MNAVRKLRPPRKPETLAELVLDFEERSPGEPEADVQFPAQDWAHLVSRAEHEKNARLAAGPEKVGASALALLQGRNEAFADVYDRFADAVERKSLEGPGGLFQDSLNSIDGLCQFVRGCVMALEIERAELATEHAARGDDIRAFSAEIAALKEELAAERTKHNGTTDEASFEDGYKAGHSDAEMERTAELIHAQPRTALGFSKRAPEIMAWRRDNEEVALRILLEGGEGCVITPDEGREAARQIAAALQKAECSHCGRGHDSAKCKERPAGKEAKAPKTASEGEPCKYCGDTDHVEAICGLAPSEPIDDEEEAPTIVERANADLMEDAGRRLNGAGWKRHAKHARESMTTGSCHHCGGETDDQATCVKGDDILPNGTFCPGCVLRLKANPREWDRHTAPPKAKVTQHRAAKLNLSGMDRKTANAARLADSGYQARARKAVKEKSPTVCHHCGASISENTGGLGTWRPGDEGGDPSLLPSTACAECRERMRADLKSVGAKPRRGRRMLITDTDPQAGLALP